MTRAIKIEATEKVEWLDISNPSETELDLLSVQYKLHPYTLKDCLEPDHLPKYENLDNFNFIILRIYAKEETQEAHTAQELTNKIAVFFNESVLITVHRRNFDFIEELKEKYIDTKKCTIITEIVTKIIWYALYSYERPALALSEEIDKFESIIFLKTIHPAQLERFYFLKRKASVCKKLLIQTQDILSRHTSTKRDKIVIQDIRDLHLKLITLFDQAQEDVNNLSNIYLSLSSQKTNDVMKLLTIFSVFFMPLTFIAGIYGMNFENMPELKMKYGYFATLFFMLVIAIIIFIWFKRKKLI